jgi:hypothetical protein
MKKFRILLIAIIIFILVIAAGFLVISSHGKITASAPIQILPEHSKASVSTSIQVLEPVVIKTVVVVNGKKNPLLCTFQDRNRALQSVKKRDADFLRLMKQKWGLNDLDPSNWKTYRQHLIAYTAGKLPDDLRGTKLEGKRQEVDGFFGIYGNDDINRETIQYLQYADFLLKTRLISQVSLDPIAGNLPFDSPLLQEAQ